MATALEVTKADITTLAVDAIVNAANPMLARGGGVCGAIHAAAGPELEQACRRIGGCPTGAARLTEGYDLPARYVVHAVGPVWHGGNQGERSLLASCYRQSLQLAADYRLRSIAFPCISTGIYGFPEALAVQEAVAAVTGFLQQPTTLQRVIFCCFDDDNLALYASLLGGDAAVVHN